MYEPSGETVCMLQKHWSICTRWRHALIRQNSSGCYHHCTATWCCAGRINHSCPGSASVKLSRSSVLSL